MAQLLLNILITSGIYLLASTSVIVPYYTTKFINISHAVIFTFAAYFTYFFSQQLGFDLWVAVPLSILLGTVSGMLMELMVYRPLRKREATSWILLITSIGLYVILQNLLSLIWGDHAKSIQTGEVKTGYGIFGAYITAIQIITITVSIVLFAAVFLYQKYTRTGKKMRAVSENSELSNILGINSNVVVIRSFVIGSALASVAGILVALDTDMIPTMGFNLLLYGVVVMIIGGVGSVKGLIGGALLLAAAQHLGAYFIDSKWMDATAYIILILFLVWKPLGFSGKRLRKIEI